MIRRLSRLSVVGALFALPFLATSAIAQAATEPSLTAQFSPDEILPGSISTLTFTIDTSPSAITPTFDLAFSAALPGDVVIAKGDVLLDCAGDLVAAEGSSSVTFIDGELPVDGVCTIEVPVSANTAGTHTLTTSTLASDQGTGTAATDDLTVLAPDVTITSSLSSSTVTPGNTVRMSYDYTLSSGLEVFRLNSTLPDGLVIATPSGVSSTCSGTFEATPGGTSFSISGAGIAATTCTVGFDLRAVDRGTYVIDTDFATTLNFPGLSATLRNELTVPSLPSDGVALDKSFSVSQASAGDTVQLTFKLQNASRSASATDLAFTDDLDGFLSGAVATGLALSNPCGAGSAISGSSTLSFSGGSLAPGAICEFSVDVALPWGAAGNNSYTNTSSALTGTLDGAPYTGSTASASLRVLGDDFKPVTLTKTFTDDPVAPGGTATIEYVLTNPNATEAAADVTFTDFLASPAGLTASFTSQCGGSFGSGDPSFDLELSFLGGAVAAGSSCTMTVTVAVPAGTPPGDYSSTTGEVEATVNGNTVASAAASDTLQILGGANLSFVKSFVDDQAAAPGQTQILFTISSAAESVSEATGIAFTDDLDAFFTGTVWSATPTNECNGTMTGTDTLSYSGGSILPGESCDILVTVALGAGTTGTYTNTTSALTATAGGQATTALASSDDIYIFEGGVLATSKEFLQDPYIAASGDPITVRYTLDNTAGISAYTSVFFTENFTAVPSLTVTTVPVDGATCGAGSSFVEAGSFFIASGLEVPAGGICTFDVELTVGATPTVDDYLFSTSSISASAGGSAVTLPALTATLNVEDGNLLISKSYGTDPVQAGDTTVAEYTITNTLSEAIDTIVFFDEVDNLFPGLAATGLPISACGGTLSGTGTVQLSNGSLAANASCTFSATLQTPASTTPDTYTGDTGSLTAQTVAASTALTGVPVSASLQVLAPATASFAKSFAPTAVGASGTTTLTYVITNLDSGSSISEIQFNDDLNDALSGLVASGLPVSDVCGSGSSLSGTSTLSLTNASLAASQSCTFDVTVQVPSSATPGSYTSTSSALSSNGLTLDDAASASFSVEPAPGFAQVISPNAIAQGGETTITYTIDNSSSSAAATSLSFSNSYPTLMLNAAVPNASTTCTGGTLTAAAGTGSLSYSGGTVPAGGSCTVEVTVQASAASGQTNTSSALTSSLGDSGTSSAALAITASPVPTFAKSFASPSLALNNSMAMTLTIDNTGALVPATSLNVSDNLPAGMVVATSPNASTTCSGGTLTATANSSSVSYSGGTVNAAQACTVVVDVTATSAGTLVNTTGQLTSSLGNSGTANASLRIPSITLTTPLTADNIITGAEIGAVTLAGTTSLVENGRTVSIQITDGASVSHVFSTTVSGDAWTISSDLSGLADGAATLSVTTSDANGSSAGPVTHAFSIDATPPTGHSVAFDASAISSANELVASFSFADAEVGATYAYTISSSGGGTNVTGSGTIASATQWVGSLNVSSLGDGTLTLSVVLTDPLGNAAPAVTNTVTKDTQAPLISFTSGIAGDDIVNSSEQAAVTVSGRTSGAEDGQSVSISIIDSLATTLTYSATVSGDIWTLDIDMTALADGALTLTASVGDDAGNRSADATASLLKDVVAPTGHSATFDASVINVANETAGSFSFAAAEVGASYSYTISSSGGGTNVTGSGTIATAADQISGLDLSVLGDGTLTLTVVLVDPQGNISTAVTDTITKDAVAPSLVFDTPLAIDDLISQAEAPAVVVSGTASGVEDGQTVSIAITDISPTTQNETATVTGGVWSVTVDMSGLGDGALSLTADVLDVAGNPAVQASKSLSLDATVPVGFGAVFDDSVINLANQSASSFSFVGAEVGATYDYTISSSAGGADVTGTGGIATGTDQITGIDLSGLNDGLLTLSVTLTDALDNTSTAVTDTITKDATAPTLAFDAPLATDDRVNGAEASAVVVSGTASGVEDGRTVSIAMTDGAPVTQNQTAIVTGGVWTVTVDLSGLGDGPLSLTADVTDDAANPAVQATASLTMDTMAPSGHTASFDDLLINVANQTTAGFSFADAEVGATYAYTISSSSGGTVVTGTGTIATATDQVTGLDLSVLSDGTLTLSVVLTDDYENAAASVADTVKKDAEVPLVALDSPVAGDNVVNAAEQASVAISGTTSGVEDGQLVTLIITDSSSAIVTGTATVGGSLFNTAFDLSSLSEGALTVTADVADAAGNTAIQSTLSLSKDTIAPSGQGIAFDQSPVNLANQTAIDLTLSGAEVGSGYALTLSSTGGGTPLSSSGTILAQDEQLTGFDLSGLSDGTVSASIVLTDTAGNVASAVTATEIKETSVPTVVLTGPAGPISDAFDVTMVFSEPVFNLGVAGFDIVGASATGLSGTGTDYTLTVLPDHDGEITIQALVNAAQDAQENPSEASAPITIIADLTGTPDPDAAADADGDGVPDDYESSSADRDGDGVADAADYDPAGYFYCEDDGRILSGGGISISGPSGSNSSVGIANDINIVQDGSSGYYQWFAQRPGTYTVTYQYPTDSGLASTARLSSGTLDVTSLLPANPAVLGSTEFGNSGSLADSSLGANPVFYSSFVIEAGDPNVLANNIPMTQCAENAVIVSATDNGAEANDGVTDSISFTIAQDRLSALDTVVAYSMSGSATEGTDYVTASGSLTIPAGNMTIDVELDVLEDGLVEGLELATLTLTAVTSADDATILSATASNLAGSASITDDDSIGIAVTNDDLTASENGRDTAAMGFSLLGQPTSDVVLNFAGDGQCSVSPSSLTFTAVNYASPQRLKIEARDDEDVEGTHSCQPTVAVASTDANFDNYSLALAEVMVADDLVDQIRDPLTEILKDDLEETVRTQQRRFSSIAKGALGRLRDGQEDTPCGTVSDPDVDGSLDITDGNGSTTGKFGWENYDCQTTRRNILDGSFSVTWSEDTGTQAVLQLSRLSEKYVSDKDLRGFFWGGYFSRNNVDSTAEGTIDGYGLNGGIYGAKATGTGLFVDYYASAAMGIHNYDLTFDADAGDINATGSYNYAALFGGVALSGKRDYETYSISPRVGLDVAQAWVSDADVTARQLGETDTGSIDLPDFTGGRFFAEIEFAGLSTKKGASSLGQMMTEYSLTPRVACEYSSYGTDPECGAGINFEVTTDDPNENLSYGFELDYERMDDLNRFRLSFSRERRFAGDQGAVVTRLSMPDTTNMVVEHGVKLDF